MRHAPMELENPLSIYIHIPFCLKKCGYCDFHSAAMRPEDVPQKDYALAVCEELRQLKKRYDLSGRPAGTIYFGGGTPTVFEPASLNIILDAIHKNFSVASDAEVSIEANPETIPLVGGLRGLLDVGFNRISIGIQSFNDRQLQTLGRIHNADTAVRAVRAAQDAGFKNVGIDLMWGLPGQTVAELEQDLGEALTLGVQHISAYQLTLALPEFVAQDFSPASSIGRSEDLRYISSRASSATTLPSEDLAHEMFLLVHDKLASAGYEHYEISNFAKIPPGPPFAKGGENLSFRCRHNLNYWRYGEWLGAGCSATSQISNLRSQIPIRFTSNRNISDYLAHKFQYEIDEIAPKAAMAEYSFMNLRTSNGIDLSDFKRRFGREFDEVYPGTIGKWVKNGWAEVKMGSDPIFAGDRTCPPTGQWRGGSPLRLSLSGWLISDELFRELV